MELLGVGAAEALVVFVITLIVVGPHRFPEIARQAGRYYRIARRYATEVTNDVRGAIQELEAEVEAQKEELEAVGTELSEGIQETVRETRSELRDIGRATGEAVSSAEPAPAREAPSTQNGQAPAPAEPSTPAAPAAPATTLQTPRELPAGDEDEAAPERRTGDE
jgi:Tat protein translocase TatB subunit